MRTSLILILLVTAVFVAPTTVVRAEQPSGPAFDVAGTDAARVSSFLKALQTSVAIDNRMKVASLFEYPVEVELPGKTLTLKGAGDLQANYSRVFDADLRQSIAQAKVDDLFANAKGVMLDNGRVWFAPVGSKQALKIIRINHTAVE